MEMESINTCFKKSLSLKAWKAELPSERVAAGMIQAEQKGKRFLCRTAASFVSARVGIIKKAPISPEVLGISRQKNGGLIVVGSYVPKTTKQVEELKLQCGHFLETIEIPVERVAMKSLEEREFVINQTVEMADALLSRSKDTLIVTSRELIKGENAAASLEINFKVSSALVEIVKRISTRPRYILAKVEEDINMFIIDEVVSQDNLQCSVSILDPRHLLAHPIVIPLRHKRKQSSVGCKLLVSNGPT